MRRRWWPFVFCWTTTCPRRTSCSSLFWWASLACTRSPMLSRRLVLQFYKLYYISIVCKFWSLLCHVVIRIDFVGNSSICLTFVVCRCVWWRRQWIRSSPTTSTCCPVWATSAIATTGRVSPMTRTWTSRCSLFPFVTIFSSLSSKWLRLLHIYAGAWGLWLCFSCLTLD